MDKSLLSVLERVKQGSVSPAAAARELARETDLGMALVDNHRAARTGVAEVVYGEGKTAAQVAAILAHLVQRGQPALATRVDEAKAAAALSLDASLRYEAVPRLLWCAPAGTDPFRARHEAKVVVLSGGTADLPVAEEAARCVEWLGLPVVRAFDVGVAGLHRLLSRLEALREARVIVAVAGMEGALPAVVAGLVRAPVVAVPTSTGYGVHLGGLTPLFAMLDSCAAGVSVVNVDNGFGAALVVGRIALGGQR